MQVYERIFATLALLFSLAVPVEATEATCNTGGGVGIDDYIVWVDIPDGGGYAEVPVWAAQACQVARTITYKTYDITARAGTDYVGVNSATFQIPGGALRTTVRIRILAKTAPEPDESFGVLLTSGARFDDPDATVTIKTR